ncbi:hypothetical protein SLEP1_g46255 [Rubroshorea leprosula]|uniref:RING-type E3 ubiquitin transferase n=1 Tax=Rubroshorea leprosula TaxID=152421 RepID=A0AAV5LLM6_9ROSI|nr:hypothetical protein SLEP1_g46255 [Rubroshorea leprosula]
MVPQGFANVAMQSPDSPLILSFITSVGIVVIILFCLMAVCVIAASFVILLIYIICECVCWPLFDRFDCDPELGRGLGRGINHARIVTYQAVIPNYLQPLDTVDERRTLRQQALEKLLPPMVYGSGKLPLRSGDCAICLDDYMVGELYRVFPPCKHMFHLNCIDNWLLDNLTCPVCRKCVLDD